MSSFIFTRCCYMREFLSRLVRNQANVKTLQNKQEAAEERISDYI